MNWRDYFTLSGAAIAWMLLALLIVATCSGCATLPPPPTVVSHIDPPPPVVRIPTLIPCATLAEIPQPPGTQELDTSLTAYQLAVTVRRKLLEWSQYAAKADSLLRGCAAETKP